MNLKLKFELENIVERKSPEEWAALAKQLKSQPVKKPEMDLFNVSGALSKYTDIPKAAYGAVSGGLTTAGTKAASAVGLSKAAAAKVGAAVGSPIGVGVAAGAAAAIVYGGYKIYKRYMTDIGRACAGAPNKKLCELQYNLRAKKAQVQWMTDNMGHKCKSTECYSSVDLKIRQLKREIDTLQSKLSRIPRQPQPDNSERREDEIFKGHSSAGK